MALTISSVTPSSGLTGGREFVLIVGTDFNISVDSEGISKMEVYFGTDEAKKVRVRSVTELDCLTPIHDLGQVDVKVVDTVAVAEVTLTDGFTYARPVIGGSTPSDVVRVTDVLVAEMKRQIIANVIVGHGADYGGVVYEDLNIIEVAETPAIVLDGPRLIESAGVLHRVGEPWVETATDVFKKKRPQDIMNLEFTLSGVDDNKVRLLNMLREVISFFRRNNVLKILADPTVPDVFEEIDMRPPFPQDWSVDTRGQDAGLKQFWGIFTLFGVPIGRDDDYDETRGITDFDTGFEITPL